MFTNNKFGKFDAVADAIKNIAEADYKAKMEELKGQQHKIDKNKNNKVDADDFKILRGEKKGMKKEEVEIEEGTESKADYHDRMHRLAAHYNSMSDEKKASLGKIPGRAEQFMQAVKYAKDNPNMKKEEVEESNNPFDLKNYKSQLPTKPGEKAGFDSKKVSTGTIYSRKPVKDEPMKKEEIDPNNTTTDTLKGREKTSNNPFLSKKVKMDVPDNVKEEAEQIDELSKDTLKSYSAKAKASAKSHRDAGNQYDSDPDERAFAPNQYKKAASRTAGAAKADSRIKEEAEQIDELSKDTLTSYATKAGKSLGGQVANIGNAKQISKFHADKTSAKEVKKDAIQTAGKRMFGLGRAASRLAKEEAEQVEERTLTPGETSEKERIVKGMKKSLKGFKARYGDKAKSVMYATATKAAKKD